MYLELLGSLIILAAGVSVVAQRGTITLGNAGLSIAFALQVRKLWDVGGSKGHWGIPRRVLSVIFCARKLSIRLSNMYLGSLLCI